MRFEPFAMALGLTAMLAGCSDLASPSLQAAAAGTTGRVGAGATSRPARDDPDAPLAREGDSYLAARARFLAAGWQPARGECSGAGVTRADCDGFPEIDTCAGTGVGHCGMAFSKPGRCLTVVTVGGRPERKRDSETKIDGFSVKDGACPRSDTGTSQEERGSGVEDFPILASSATTACARLERDGVSDTVRHEDFVPDYPAALQDPARVEATALSGDDITNAVRALTCGAGLSGFGPDVLFTAAALFESRRHGGAAMSALRRLSAGGAGTEALAARGFLDQMRDHLAAAREGNG